jgi:hypothetical protein
MLPPLGELSAKLTEGAVLLRTPSVALRAPPPPAGEDLAAAQRLKRLLRRDKPNPFFKDISGETHEH